MTIRFGIVLILNLYITRVILRELGTDDFGIYNVVGGLVTLLAFVNTSMTNGIQRFYNTAIGQNDSRGIRSIYKSALKIQGLLAIIVLIAAETAGVWYVGNQLVVPSGRETAAMWILQTSVLSFLLVIMQVPYSSIIIAREKMDFYALVSVADALMKLGIVLLLPFLGGDHLIWYGILLALIAMINFGLYSGYTKVKKLLVIEGPNDQDTENKAQLNEILKFSGWNILGTFAYVMREQGVDILLNAFFGTVVNAARGVANQVNSGLQSMVGNMTTAVRPQVVQSYAAKDMDRTLKLTFSISKMSCSILYAMALPIMLEIDFILNIWLDGIVPEHTSSFLLLIVGISFISNLNSAVSGIIHASGKMMVYQTVTSAITLFSIPAGYIALKIGATAETVLTIVLICVGIGQCASLRIMKNVIDYKIKDYLKQVILPLILMIAITLPISATVHYFMDEGWMRLITVLVVSEICVGSVIYFIIMNANERALIKNLIHKKI